MLVHVRCIVILNDLFCYQNSMTGCTDDDINSLTLDLHSGDTQISPGGKLDAEKHCFEFDSYCADSQVRHCLLCACFRFCENFDIYQSMTLFHLHILMCVSVQEPKSSGHSDATIELDDDDTLDEHTVYPRSDELVWTRQGELIPLQSVPYSMSFVGDKLWCCQDNRISIFDLQFQRLHDIMTSERVGYVKCASAVGARDAVIATTNGLFHVNDSNCKSPNESIFSTF